MFGKRITSFLKTCEISQEIGGPLFFSENQSRTPSEKVVNEPNVGFHWCC